MPEFTIWLTNYQCAVLHIEAETEEEAIAEAKDRYENRELDYYEEKIGSFEVDQEG